MRYTNVIMNSAATPATRKMRSERLIFLRTKRAREGPGSHVEEKI
jgi:hypothetical protein